MDLNNAKPILVSNKPLFDRYFREFPPETSELTFTNLFMWRHHYNYQFLEVDGHLVIFSNTFLKRWRSPILGIDGCLFFLAPIGNNPEKIILDLYKNSRNIEFHRVPESIANKLKESGSLNQYNLEIVEDRNNWDYVYEFQSITSLAGKSLRQKRRWLTKFVDTYNYKFQLINQDNIEDYRSLQLEWCDNYDCANDEDLKEEEHAIFEAFENFKGLKFTGGIIGADGNCIAYTLGEMLNENTFVIHIEKAHTDYEGSYQAINNLFLKNLNFKIEFVNREQDLGIAGLRKAKESYKPHHMVKKYILY